MGARITHPGTPYSPPYRGLYVLDDLDVRVTPAAVGSISQLVWGPSAIGTAAGAAALFNSASGANLLATVGGVLVRDLPAVVGNPTGLDGASVYTVPLFARAADDAAVPGLVPVRYEVRAALWRTAGAPAVWCGVMTDGRGLDAFNTILGVELYAPAGGTWQVRTRTASAGPIVVVTDTGLSAEVPRLVSWRYRRDGRTNALECWVDNVRRAVLSGAQLPSSTAKGYGLAVGIGPAAAAGPHLYVRNASYLLELLA